MRIGLTTGPLPHHRFFIQRFFEEFKDDLIFSITQLNTKRSKGSKILNLAKKSFQHLSGWDSTQSYLLSRIYNKKSKKLLDSVNFPHEIDFAVDDINSNFSENIIRESNIDILVVFGGKIIKENILSLPKRESYTLHLGWCPDYKGSHGLHWAIHDENYSKLGLSILTLSNRVDAGEIVLRKRIDTKLVKDEYDLMIFAQKLAIEEIIKVIKLIKETGKLPSTEMQTKTGNLFLSKDYTPIVKGCVRRNMKRIKLLESIQ